MYTLPTDADVNINYLNQALDDMTNSYKIFCLKGIYDEIIIGNTEITFETLSCRMIQNVWHPLLKYKLNFGKQDKLAKIVDQIYNNSNIDNNIEITKLLFSLKNVVNKNIIDNMMRYVPYRIIRPTFEDQLKNIKGDNAQQKLIIELCRENKNSLYRIYKEKRLIIVNEKWSKYIINNQAIILGWLKYKLLEFLQKRNPNTPAIIYKLQPPIERNLSVQTKIWTNRIKQNQILDIYTDLPITSTYFNDKHKVSIDHFIPWSFIGHNMIWNLIPTFININSSKNDNLPRWDKYFVNFAKLQYSLFIYLKTNINQKDYKKLLEDYLQIFSELDINDITSSNFNITEEFFIQRLSQVINPLYQIAFNQGFSIWEYYKELDIIPKTIESKQLI